MAANARTVTPKANGGGWTVQGGSDTRTYQTQEQARNAARSELEASGGGELLVKGEDGTIRTKDTIGRADPRKSKG